MTALTSGVTNVAERLMTRPFCGSTDNCTRAYVRPLLWFSGHSIESGHAQMREHNEDPGALSSCRSARLLRRCDGIGDLDRAEVAWSHEGRRFRVGNADCGLLSRHRLRKHRQDGRPLVEVTREGWRRAVGIARREQQRVRIDRAFLREVDAARARRWRLVATRPDR